VTLIAADAGPSPMAFVAVTEQLYVTPFVSPPTVIGLADRVAEWESVPALHVAE
jgi:hypothetical protein